MNIIRILAFAFLLWLIQSDAIGTIQVPKSLDAYAVFHVKVKQLNEFSCGYNAIFNAANVQQWCGYANYMSDFSRFRQACFDFTSAHGLKRKAALNNKRIEDLARQMGIPSIAIFHLDERRAVAPLLSKEVYVTFRSGTPESEIRHLLENEYKRQQTAYVNSLKTDLGGSTSFPYIQHIVCIVYVNGVSHGILASVIKNSTGCGLYIFDNTNRLISEGSEIRKCIAFLIETFSVSARRSYTGPSFPTCWPSLRSQDHSLAAYVS